jgi:S1-C subfamily serine protease
MKQNRISLLALVITTTVMTACSPAQLQRSGTATPMPTDLSARQIREVKPTASQTPTPTPRPTATATSTPAPLTAAEIFDRISPSVVFVDTPAGTGSGVLLEGNYIVTNAHVVWPYRAVRIVLADGTEHTDVPVLNWDLLADLAIAGPLETSVDPVPLVDGEALIIGSPVYLIGYPGEVEKFPRPTISGGVISRRRESTALGLTYFQTDAQIAGGQSGGVLVSEMGEVIGISGRSFTEVSFGLAASAADLQPRIAALIAGEDVAGLGERRIPVDGGQPEQTFELASYWDSRVYVVREPIGTNVEVSVESAHDAAVDIINVNGNRVLSLDDGVTGFESGSMSTQLEAPYFVRIGQLTDGSADFRVRSNHPLIPFDDPDDGDHLRIGDGVRAALDYPGDLDYFVIDLEAGETVHLLVASSAIDPVVAIDYEGAKDEQVIGDDDSGGGVFGLDAELTYRAPHDDRYRIAVLDPTGTAVGGYMLSLDRPGADSPTPSAPLPTPTAIVSDLGPMALYASQRYPFAIQYPADWNDLGTQPNMGVVANYGSGDTVLSLAEEDLEAIGLGGIALSHYTDLVVSTMKAVMPDLSVIARRPFDTAEGVHTIVIEFTGLGGTYRGFRLVYAHEGKIGFSATYVFPSREYQRIKALANYTFSTFQITARP